ncbi:MAG: hypothetical protein L0387_19155 [Acidobacteria bacterium]|nr:hypothetical protein [Acidobacteriota bacterium]MCI0718595.1 hypothetical protein [Acidobacteriota bacterium]
MRLRWRSVLAAGCAILVLGQAAPAQQRVPLGSVYERLWCVVPMVGAGTFEDSTRPAYVPEHLLPPVPGKPRQKPHPFSLAQAKGEAPKAIISFTDVPSDDGRFALVEFQATDRSAFLPLLEAARTPGASLEPGSNRNALDGYDLKAFEAGKAKRSDIEAEFRKHKKDFNLESFLRRLP